MGGMTVLEATDVLQRLAAGAPAAPGRVTLQLRRPCSWLRIENPGARNAMTLSMMCDLARAVDALSRWDGPGLLLSAEGPVFCAGGHLGQVTEAIAGEAEAELMCRAMTTVLDALLELPMISVAAIGGPALGGGAELATATDLRVFGRAGRMQFVQSKLGIASGWGGVRRLARHVGRRTALRLAAIGEAVDGPEALGLGLADDTADSAEEGALRLLARYTVHPPAAVRAAKAQVVAAERDDPEGDVRAFAPLWGGPDHRTALAKGGWGR